MTPVSISRDALEKAIALALPLLEGARQSEIYGNATGATGRVEDVEDDDALEAIAELDAAIEALTPLRAALTAETKIPGREEIARAMAVYEVLGLDVTEAQIEDESDIACRLLKKSINEKVSSYFGFADAVLSLLPAQAEEWRDIASAPKDGTPILAVARWMESSAGFPRIVHWMDDAWRAPSRGYSAPLIAWAWMPRPKSWPAEPDLKSKDTVTK